MPRGSQLMRQWHLLQLLARPEGLAVEDAAARLQCAVRTIWRDLRVLQDVGFPIYDEQDGRRGVWRVERGFLDRLPLPLSLSEIVALLVTHDVAATDAGSPFGPAVASVFTKFRALLSPRALSLIDRMRSAVAVRVPSSKPQSGATDWLRALQSALLERRSLHIRYYSMGREAETERRVDPYNLTYFNGGLYLVGYCHMRQAVRTFAVERIRSIDLLAETFTAPPDFKVDEYLKGAWGITRGGDLVTVTAVFSKAIARYIRERTWHASQQVRDLAGGRLQLTLKVADTVELKRWLLGFGADAEVLAPAALREALRLEAERLAVRLASARKPPARTEALPPRRRSARTAG